MLPGPVVRSVPGPEAMTPPTSGFGPFDELRAEFLRLLTTNSQTKDRRRRDFNQAIFDAEAGWAIWSATDLDMVMSKFDKAVGELKR